MTFATSKKLETMARSWPGGREHFYSRFTGAAKALMTDEQTLYAMGIIETFREQDARMSERSTQKDTNND